MESMTRSTHMKKLPKGVTSFSGGYDGVFSAPAAAHRFKPPSNVEDYGEIFGGGSRGSSIPVLDLAVLDETTENFRSSKVDYGSIFGGFEEDLGVPYDELVGRGCGNKKWSSSSDNKASNHSEKEFPPQGEGTHHLSGNSKELPSEAPNTSIDAMKQFNMSYLKTSQENKKQPNGTTHVAKLHAVPGFTYFVNEPPSKKKTEPGMPVAPIKGEVHRTWSFGGNVPDENNRNTEILLPGKPIAEGLSGAKGGSSQVGNQPKDGSFNRIESDMKSQSFKTAPSSNNFYESSGIRGHPKQSKSSNISSKVNPFEKSTSNGIDGSSDEELDINSDAAACAAALKRVLEKAQESIRLAQEIRERGDKDGIQRGSNLNSEHSSKAKDKKKHGFDQEGNYSKKQNVKDRHERLGSESDESNERHSRFSSSNAGVSTASECGQKPLTSTEPAEEKSRLNIAEVNGKSKQFLEPVETGTNIASTVAIHQVEMDMDKSTTFLSMRKQETEASLSMEKQENIFGVTTTKETTEQMETNVEIEKSSEKDFGMGNAENNEHLDEHTKLSEVTANASYLAPIKHEFRTTEGLEITDKDSQSEDIKCILDKLRHCEIKLSECLDMSEEEKSEASKTVDQHMSNEWQTMAKEEVPHEDFQQVQYFNSHSQEEKENGLYSFNKGGELHQEACGIVTSDDAPEVCGSGSLEREHKESQEGEARATLNGLDSFHEEDMVQQEACGFMESDDSPEICGSGNQESTHKDGQEGEPCTASNGLDSCNERGMIQQEACGFVANDDAPEICNSGSQERTHKDSQEGEACAASNRLDSCHEQGMVQQEACGFMASYDAPEDCSRGSWERTHTEGQEGEPCRTFDAIQEIGVNDSNLVSGHKLEEDPTVPYEELEKKVVEDPNEKELVDVPREEKSTKVLKEEYFEGEEQKISEDSYNQEKVDCNAFGEEFDWGEVEKRIKKGCTIEDTEIVWSEKFKNSECSNTVELIQETEETTGVHEEDTFDNNEQIHLQKKVAYEKNFDTYAYESLHGVPEAHSTGVVEDHEASNSTTGTSEDFYNCEWHGYSEEVLKACDFTKLDEKCDTVFVDSASSSENPGRFMAVESDEIGTNANYNGLSCEHKLPQENVLETTYFIQDAEEDNDIRFKQQGVSEDQKSTNVAFSADRRGILTEKNVKEPEPSINFESGGEFIDRISENAERANEEFSFVKEDEYADPEVVRKVEKKEKEINEKNSSPVTHQATDTHESAEEMITGQNIQFVRSKPQKIALPEHNEVRESSQKDLKEKEHSRKIEEMKRERARDKDRIAVERAIREARERAFAEARERAERAAVARAGAEVRQRMMAEAQEKLEKASAETKLADKASIEAKQRAERAAVERATAEARERALEKALSQKTTSQGRVQTDRLDGTPKDSALKHSLSSSDLERDGNNSESAQRRKARNERHERIMERAAQALAEKNMRDLQAQKEQAERNRLAESLDADVKRWANGKEKNLRALLSTLQYILGPDSGWQPISLTEIVTTAAVKKAYKKSTLYVHPDKLQQRGASIQQKYICEKVFELLKAAWNKFNSEER
ncbi:membrane traffic protein [Lithospermum erythrorhizon]|uniref:Membrane traffic protein n=1 Tax=Lithospermum erythrorhizon TaxID=34254 RepID=A0AAV3QJH4_LITER